MAEGGGNVVTLVNGNGEGDGDEDAQRPVKCGYSSSTKSNGSQERQSGFR